MDQVIIGVGTAVFALVLGLAWRERLGKPWVYGGCALMGAFGLGWSLAAPHGSTWAFTTALVLLLGGVVFLAEWIGWEIKTIERQRATQAQRPKRQPKKKAAD